MKFLSSLSDSDLKKKIIENYKEYPEFKQLIDVLQEIDFKFFQLDRFKILISNYIISLKKCNEKSPKCNQPIEGYRSKLIFENNLFFTKLVNCKHGSSTNKKLEMNYQKTDFPKQFLEKSFSDVLDINNKERYELLQFMNEFIKFGSFHQKSGFFLHGPNFVGKTFLTVVFCNRIISLLNKKIIFINVSEMVSYYQNNNNFQHSFLPFLNQLKKIDILVIDNFGMESPNQYFRDNFLMPLFYFRFNENLPILLISNFTLSECINNYIFSSNVFSRKKMASFLKLLNDRLKIFHLNSLITK